MQASTTNTHRPEDAKLQTSAPSFGSCVTAPILHLPEVSWPEAACMPWPAQPCCAGEHGKHQLGGSQRMSFYRNQQLAGLALCFQSQQLTLQPRHPTHTSPLSCIRCMWHDEHKACPTLPGFYNTCTTTGAHLPLGEELPRIHPSPAQCQRHPSTTWLAPKPSAAGTDWCQTAPHWNHPSCTAPRWSLCPPAAPYIPPPWVWPSASQGLADMLVTCAKCQVVIPQGARAGGGWHGHQQQHNLPHGL